MFDITPVDFTDYDTSAPSHERPILPPASGTTPVDGTYFAACQQQGEIFNYEVLITDGNSEFISCILNDFNTPNFILVLFSKSRFGYVKMKSCKLMYNRGTEDSLLEICTFIPPVGKSFEKFQERKYITDRAEWFAILTRHYPGIPTGQRTPRVLPKIFFKYTLLPSLFPRSILILVFRQVTEENMAFPENDAT